jgi:hypothetical protein
MLAERRAAGKALLECRSIQGPSPSFENRVFRAFAFSDEPLLARDVQLALAATGPVPDDRLLRDYLDEHPSFVRKRGHRWQLGRQLTVRCFASGV